MGVFGAYVFIGLGLLASINAVVIMVLTLYHRMTAYPVFAEVIELRETTDSDDGVAFAPVFRVIDGVHAGEIWSSWATSAPSTHKVGDKVSATYNRRTGVIQSGKTKRGSYVLGIAMMLASIACFNLSQVV